MRPRSLVIVALFALVGCSTATPAASTAPSAASPAPSATTAAPLTIGVLVPFTESALDSDVGASQRRAAELFVKLHNGKLGGRDVQLVWNDESELTPATNDVRIKQFIEKDHATILMGGVTDATSYQLRAAAEANKLVYIDTNAYANALTRTTATCAPACLSRYVFRSSATAWQMSEPLGEWAAKNRQKDYVLLYEDDPYGTDSAAGFADGLAKSGGRATGRTAVAPKSGADWKAIVAQLKAQPSKGVFAALATDDAEGLVDAWSTAGMTAAGYALYGPGPLADAEVIRVTKQGATGVLTAYPWSSELANAENKSFVDAFRSAYKEEDTGRPLTPDGYALQMWDALLALDQALSRASGDARSDALIPALEGVSVAAPDGTFAIDKTTHNPVHDIYIREVRAVNGVLVQAVVEKISAVRDPGQ